MRSSQPGDSPAHDSDVPGDHRALGSLQGCHDDSLSTESESLRLRLRLSRQCSRLWGCCSLSLSLSLSLAFVSVSVSVFPSLSAHTGGLT
eukprot:3101935-Rhodomonas_salina.1